MLSKWSLQMVQWEIMQQILETPPETSLCAMDKKPEITQECGASAKEEEDAEPTEEKAEEVSYTMHYVEQ